MTQPAGNQPAFFGQKVSKTGINVNSAGDNQLILKDDYSTRTYYDSLGNIVLQLGKLTTGNYGLSGNNATIVLSNNGIEQIIFGLLPDNTYGLVISKPGVDVRTAFS